jgi:hypothetical protein
VYIIFSIQESPSFTEWRPALVKVGLHDEKKDEEAQENNNHKGNKYANLSRMCRGVTFFTTQFVSSALPIGDPGGLEMQGTAKCATTLTPRGRCGRTGIAHGARYLWHFDLSAVNAPNE